MFLDEKDLKTSNNLIKGFEQKKILVVGVISLQLALGEGEHSTTKIINFLVLDSHQDITRSLEGPRYMSLKLLLYHTTSA